MRYILAEDDVTLSIEAPDGTLVITFPPDERQLAEYVILSMAKVAEGHSKHELRELYERVRVTHDKQEEN